MFRYIDIFNCVTISCFRQVSQLIYKLQNIFKL